MASKQPHNIMEITELRRLLELAAKAVGGVLLEGTGRKRTGATWNEWKWCGPVGILLPCGKVSFPHLDDGDSRRLEVALAMRVMIWPAGAEAEKDTRFRAFVRNDEVGDDPCAATRLAVLLVAAATRLAVLLVAAAIGESMP